MYYHGTTEESFNSILLNGFNSEFSEYTRWGKGVYFSDNINTALNFGKKIIPKVIDNDLIMNINYRELGSLFSDLSIEDEEGTPELRNHILNNTDYKIVAIKYDDGETELVVYDDSLINV